MSASDEPLGALRARFLRAFRAGISQRDEATRLCEICVSVLPVTRAGISLYVDGVGLEVLAASDEIAERLEWMQVTLGEGAGVDAVATGEPVVVTDLSTMARRWPMFANEAAGAGASAMCAVPLQVGAMRVGVLDLYRDTPAELAATDFANAVVVAEIVTAILLSTERGDTPPDSLGSLWDQPLGARVVQQATGMIVAQLAVSAQEAYHRLKAYAYAHGRLLSDVADDVVHRRLKFTPDTNADPDADASSDPSIPS